MSIISIYVKMLPITSLFLDGDIVMLLNNFSPAIWKIFIGNLLLLICIIFYLAWWIVTFKRNTAKRRGQAFYIAAAFIIGIISILIIASGIAELARFPQAIPVRLILIAIALSFLILLIVTAKVFHRAVTSELLLIHIWAAVEICMVNSLYSSANISFSTAWICSAVILLSILVSLICYVFYYRLCEKTRYRTGMIPLALAGLCAIAILLMLLTA